MKSLHDILSTFGDKYLTGKELNKARIIHDIDRYDEEIIMALLNNDLIKKHYAKQIGEYTIIETNKLIETFEMDDYWMDSYTKYTKKIGLTANGRFLEESTDVVLDFPYKDTVLKAGMSKEDVANEDFVPNEPFFNEVIAAEEIDMLLDKKILVNAKRYTANAIEEAIGLSKEDNLILKGNNLLALHTLKEKYSQKIKLVYLDPPYNTGNDSFVYNDKFNRSTWLVFMKNRLTITRDLMREDGIIVIQCDYHQNSYLRVLMDEIFGENNFVSEVTVQMSTASGPKMANINSKIPKLKDSLLIYSKGNFVINTQPYKPKMKWDKEYSKILMNFKKEDRIKFDEYLSNNKYEEAKAIIEQVRLSTISVEYPKMKKDIEWLNENSWRIVADKQNTGLDNLLSKSNRFWGGDISVAKTARGNISLFRTDKKFGDDTRLEIIFADKNMNEHVGDIWTDISTSGGFSAEGGVQFPTAKKPEKLLKRIIEMFTYENDLVLDFFMGAASTQATALKLGRRFIGVEQMDYIEDTSVKRLMNVIAGDQTGISKDVDWQGGGSFVYAELMEKSKGYLQEVLQATDSDQLNAIYQLMLENVDLDFRADLESAQEMLKDTISLEDKKRLLIKVIDKNQLYYNYAEIDDTNVRELISDADYAFNQSFYEEDRDGQKDS